MKIIRIKRFSGLTFETGLIYLTLELRVFDNLSVFSYREKLNSINEPEPDRVSGFSIKEVRL